MPKPLLRLWFALNPAARRRAVAAAKRRHPSNYGRAA